MATVHKTRCKVVVRPRLRAGLWRAGRGGRMALEVAKNPVQKMLHRRRVVAFLVADARKGDRAAAPQAQALARHSLDHPPAVAHLVNHIFALRTGANIDLGEDGARHEL